MVQEGMFVQETLALQAGTVCSINHSKAWHIPVVDLCQCHVVISGPYNKGSVKNGKKKVLCSPMGDEITTHGYMALTFAKCTTIMIAELAVSCDLRSSLE
jgi:hypothetical protein